MNSKHNICSLSVHNIVSGKWLDSNGNEITADDAGTTQNPITGISVSATGLVLSGAILTAVLTAKKKKH